MSRSILLEYRTSFSSCLSLHCLHLLTIPCHLIHSHSYHLQSVLHPATNSFQLHACSLTLVCTNMWHMTHDVFLEMVYFLKRFVTITTFVVLHLYILPCVSWNGLLPRKFFGNNNICSFTIVCTNMCFLKWYIS